LHPMTRSCVLNLRVAPAGRAVGSAAHGDGPGTASGGGGGAATHKMEPATRARRSRVPHAGATSGGAALSFPSTASFAARLAHASLPPGPPGLSTWPRFAFTGVRAYNGT